MARCIRTALLALFVTGTSLNMKSDSLLFDPQISLDFDVFQSRRFLGASGRLEEEEKERSQCNANG